MDLDKPTSVVLDGDLLVFRAAYWADKEGIDELEGRLQNDIKMWTPPGCTTICVALSCSSRNNFRRKFWPFYKETRKKQEKPACLYDAYGILQEIPGICIYKESILEADDIIGIEASSGRSIGVSLDKDLLSTPGWHWNPSKQKAPEFITEDKANETFVKQWITGDSTDNVWGLWKVGPKKAEIITQGINYDEMVKKVWQLYLEEDWTKRPQERIPEGNKEDFALAQARSVRILRTGDFNKETKEIKLWSPQ